MNINENFFDFDAKCNILLNSVINFLLIEYKEEKFTVQLRFNLPHRSDYKLLVLSLNNVISINLNQSIKTIGQQIHNYKFLRQNDNYYLSLDPDESFIEPMDSDQDIFIFNSITFHID